jgi:hypothetical protein
VFIGRGCSTAHVPNIHPPAGFDANAASTTVPGNDLTGVQLAAVEGTTVPVTPRASGTAHLSGAVNGPQGAVPGATVRVEHLVTGDPAPIDVVTGADGRYDLPNIAGGRYRVRAFLVPALAQVEPQVFFLEDATEQTIDLTLDNFASVGVSASIAPDPPTLNKEFTLVLRIARRTVGTDGVVRGEPIQNAAVAVTGAQGFNVKGASNGTTDVNGDVLFSIDCKSANASQLQIAVRPTVTEAPQSSTVQISACVDPNATTTTESSSSSGASSSSSKSPN